MSRRRDARPVRVADVYALISTYEPFGVAVREAAAAGLPIVCTRTAGAAGTSPIDGRNALLVNPYNVDDGRARARAPRVRRRTCAGGWRDESRAIDRETDGIEVDAFVGGGGRGGGDPRPAQQRRQHLVLIRA